jgi:exodeoxyribonuclease V beta subunit
MIPLDTRSFPLSGSSLIEASAGTGKTYTIVNLYLRLLLGDECQPLSVDKILVVTFTNAATAELKQRIRQRLRKAYLDFYAGHSSDDFIQHLIARSADLALDSQRLLLAGKQMDEAAVFTIHGFCQRMLTQHAFESGALYEQSLILDESQWLKLAVEDYWRRHIVPLPFTILSQLLKIWAAPGHLRNNLQSLLYRKVRPLQDVQVADAHRAVETYTAGVADVKRWWLDNNVAEQLLAADLKGNTKLGKLTIIRDMQVFCHSGDLEPAFDKQPWGVFTPEKVQGARKKTSKDLSALDFSRFESLVKQQKTASDALLQAYSGDALMHCAHNLARNKERLQLLSPDDLLMNLHHALAEQAAKPEPEQMLASAIQGGYPVALIDEFQDTDATQFAIFSLIYTPQYHDNPPCWVAIGDPKQAIYAFRGADIFTYIEAKQLVSASRQFTLATNWRSQPALVEAINGIFSQSEAGFLFEDDIPFYGVQSVGQPPGLVIGDTPQACLQFHHLTATDGLPIGWTQAQSVMAERTAGQIAQFLDGGEQGQTRAADKPLRAGDCCVLVRDRNEADAIKQALGRYGVDSVFLARKSVFASQTAVDLFALLQALADPGNDRFLRSALVSELFTYDALELDTLFNHELHWQQLVEQFIYWHQQWQRHGLMMAVNLLLRHFSVAEKLVEHYGDGQRRLTDLRHLIELLQVQSQLMSGQSQLLHWFSQRLAEPDHNHEGQQIRLETEENLVQIITQHTSKGLEFPLVFIPFASRYRAAKDAIYHHGEQGLVVDFLAEEQPLQQADHERLAEDIRLLYVALTRAVHYCFVGIWNNAHTQRKKESQLQLTALGRVLFKAGEPINEALIATRLTDLQQNLDVAYCPFDGSSEAGQNSPNSQPSLLLEDTPAKAPEPHWQVAHLERPVQRKWRLTSYSAISSQQQHIEFIAPGLDEGVDKADMTAFFANAELADSLEASEALATSEADELAENQTADIQPMDQFAFTRGPQAGSFLHGVLENIEFMHPVQLAESIAQQGKWYGIDEGWYPMLEIWLADILRAPFTAAPGDLCLAQLSQRQVLVEMEFHLPLREVQAGQFNQLLNRFYPKRQHHYQFEQLHGMLKGYIDLTFEYNGKFYVADYKSNHLGDSLDHYTPGALEQAMTEHDYQLQAILYTLALHRWLGIKLSDYQYETHIGGAYYLFLRGMNSQAPGVGVFHILPDKGLILALDALFAGHYTDESSKPDNATDTQADTTQGQLDLW